MKRKDCEQFTGSERGRGMEARRVRISTCWSGLALVSVLVSSSALAQAGTIRLWPTAVVTGANVRLTDLCALQGFDADAERALQELVVIEAPPPGGSRFVHLEMVRQVLGSGLVNMADVTLRGATQCTVSRPQAPSRDATDSAAESPIEPAIEEVGDAGAGSLRDAVLAYFQEQFRSSGVAVDIAFDHTAEQVLSLSGPAYRFHVERRGGGPAGLVPVEVAVYSGGQRVQVVPMVIQVALRRNVVVARRPINQGATIRDVDVELVSILVSKLDEPYLDEAARAVGQRARRFMPAGARIAPDELESVPLVQRGELVTMAAEVGGIRVVTTAKADDAGLLGEVIKVRGVENKRLEFDAVVVAPGRVEVGSAASARSVPALALGGGS